MADDRPLRDRLAAATWSYRVDRTGEGAAATWQLVAMEPGGRLAFMRGDTRDPEAVEVWLERIVAEHDHPADPTLTTAAKIVAAQRRGRRVGLAVVVCLLAWIWLGDGRFGWTALVLALVALLFASAAEAGARELKRRGEEVEA